MQGAPVLTGPDWKSPVTFILEPGFSENNHQIPVQDLRLPSGSWGTSDSAIWLEARQWSAFMALKKLFFSKGCCTVFPARVTVLVISHERWLHLFVLRSFWWSRWVDVMYFSLLIRILGNLIDCLLMLPRKCQSNLIKWHPHSTGGE